MAHAFATPTVVHFAAALLLSALLQVPWPTIAAVAALWGVLGAGGLAYAVIMARRMRRQSMYEPVSEDWLFHVALPLVAYGTLAASPLATPFYEGGALFGVGGAALLLLFIGIHNAWDSVADLVFVRGLRGHPDSKVSEEESEDKGRER